MKQLIIISIIACIIYLAYINWDKINTTISTGIKNEKTFQTIQTVNIERNNLNSEAQGVLDNN